MVIMPYSLPPKGKYEEPKKKTAQEKLAGIKARAEQSKARWAAPTFRAYMSAKVKAHWADPVNKANLSRILQAKWDSDDGTR